MLKTFLKDGTPYMQWCENKGYAQTPVDVRLGREQTVRINQQLELETIEFQERLLELELQREADTKAIRDSYELYDDEELIEG